MSYSEVAAEFAVSDLTIIAGMSALTVILLAVIM